MLNIIKQHFDWLSFVVLAVVFVLYPQIDLVVSSQFYDTGLRNWPLSDNPIAISIYGLFRYLPFLLVPVLLIAVVASVFRFGPKGQDKRVLIFLLVTLLAGPGILVHSVFKEGFDRARPKNIEQFDGRKAFTPAFVISDTCSKGCNSFVSGHAAMGFWFMALGWVFHSRAWFWTGVLTGVVLGATRIVQGGHFLSDTLFAGYICYFTLRVCAWKLLGESRVLMR